MLKWLWVSILVVFFDQLTKWMAEAQIEGAKYVDGVMVESAEIIPVIPHLNLTLAYNYGAAFNLLGDQSGWQRWFFAILAIVVSVFILYWLKKLKDNDLWTAIGLTLVLGGAIGNLVDRIMYGRVIDFIDFYINFKLPLLHQWQDGYWHFATFNVADIAITLGATLLVLISLFQKDEEPEKEKSRVL